MAPNPNRNTWQCVMSFLPPIHAFPVAVRKCEREKGQTRWRGESTALNALSLFPH